MLDQQGNGHVIINSTFSPDKYDNALATYITKVFPGRASKIVKRSDLANPKRAAAKGYPYRLIECGFISNATDRSIFNTNIDEIAKGIFSCFDIKVSGSSSSSTSPSKPTSSTSSKTVLKVDSWWGKDTTKRLQQIFGTTVDGIVSNQFSCYKSQNPGLDSGWKWEKNPTGNSPLIKAIQKKVGATQDGHIGPDTIKKIQKWMGCTQDGVFSAKSPCIKKLQQWCNNQK